MLSTPYTLFLLAAAAISAALAVYVWRRREARGAGAVVLMMLAVFVWSFEYAFEIGAAGLGVKVFWAKVEYLGIVTVPFAWLIFALRYTGRDRWVTRRNLALLAAVPLATLLLVATNEAHGLIWSRTALSPSGRFLALDYSAGFWVYSYVLLVLDTYLLVSMLIRSPRVYREQGRALLVAVAALWVGNGMYVTGLSLAPNLNPAARRLLTRPDDDGGPRRGHPATTRAPLRRPARGESRDARGRWARGGRGAATTWATPRCATAREGARAGCLSCTTSQSESARRRS